jgi:protein HIRA/HIR1
MHFRLPELGNVAPPGSRETFLETWKFKRPARTDFVNGSGAAGATAGKPNMLVARKGKNAARPASTALLPIPPAGAPQNITINKDGKRRIQPAFLGLGGIVAQPLSSVSSASNAASSASAAVYAPPIQPTASTSAIPYQPTPSMAGVQSYEDDDQSADDQPLPNGHGPHHRTSLQGVGVPSWGAPQDRPVQHAQYNNKKRKVADLDYDDDHEPANLAPHRPPGRSLGGDRQFASYDGEPVEIMPAYIPETIVHVPQESLKLAVPATKAFQSLKWDKEDEEADKLEVRNYESNERAYFTTRLFCIIADYQVTGPSEIAQINAKGKPEWLDYLPSPIVLAAFSPYFAAISCQNQTLHVYSPNGRR